MRFSPASIKIKYDKIVPQKEKYAPILGEIEIDFVEVESSFGRVLPFFVANDEFLVMFEDMLTYAYDHNLIDMRLAERMQGLASAVLVDREAGAPTFIRCEECGGGGVIDNVPCVDCDGLGLVRSE